ncbi:mammalian cell entry protein [Nocardia sp. NPDC052001]|uniref:mammalian cell entry protein n=1 Tax=Nocardia sp. NPDC052001 TaxID=3154853 RepID=UPI003444223A
MPAFGMPGVTASPTGARRAGVIATAVAVALLAGWRIAPFGPDPDTMSVTLLTDKVGAGIESGVDVRLDGVKVGTVSGIANAGTGRQRINLQLTRSQLFGLTDNLSIAYAPGNLFGISELTLRTGTGGRRLDDAAVVDLTGAEAGRVVDATISTLLQSLGQLTTQVLTPRLATVLSQISGDLKAFTPLLQTIVATAQQVADTQRLPSSFLLQQYGSTLSGLPYTTDGLLRVLDAFYNAPDLKSDADREKFDASVVLVRDHIDAALPTLLNTARPYFNGYTDALAPVLTAFAHAAPPAAEVTELLDRLRAAMPDTPDGPVLRLDVALRGVPGLAVPLLQGLSPNIPGADR